jgi:hypothetical protein
MIQSGMFFSMEMLAGQDCETLSRRGRRSQHDCPFPQHDGTIEERAVVAPTTVLLLARLDDVVLAVLLVQE